MRWGHGGPPHLPLCQQGPGEAGSAGPTRMKQSRENRLPESKECPWLVTVGVSLWWKDFSLTHRGSSWSPWAGGSASVGAARQVRLSELPSWLAMSPVSIGGLHCEYFTFCHHSAMLRSYLHSSMVWGPKSPAAKGKPFLKDFPANLLFLS